MFLWEQVTSLQRVVGGGRSRGMRGKGVTMERDF